MSSANTPAAASSTELLALRVPEDTPTNFRRKNWTSAALFFVDVAVIEVALLLGYIVRLGLAPWLPIDLPAAVLHNLFLSGLVMPLAYTAAGLHPGFGLAEPERLRRRTIVSATVFSLFIFWDYFAQAHQWSRGVLGLAFAFALLLGPLASRLTIGILAASGLWGKPVVIIGPSDRIGGIVDGLRREWRLGFRPVGVYSDAASANIDLPHLGTLRDARCGSVQVGTAVVLIPASPSPSDLKFLNQLPFAQVVAVPSWKEVQTLWITARDMGGTLGLEMNRGLLLRQNQFIKRLLDCALASLGLMATLPLILVSAVLVAIIDPGFPFFVHERRGKKGRIIRVCKIRSMYRDAEPRLQHLLRTHPGAAQKWGAHYKLDDDPRILWGIGKFMRSSSIDELPQFWNVLRGDMSLVGPRPFPDYHLNAFDDSFRELRTTVLPGLTGLWQVQGRSAATVPVQIAMDRYYILNWSIWMDIDIIARTFWALMSRRGAH